MFLLPTLLNTRVRITPLLHHNARRFRWQHKSHGAHKLEQVERGTRARKSDSDKGRDEDRNIVAMAVSEIESVTMIKGGRNREKSQDLLMKDPIFMLWTRGATRLGFFIARGQFCLGRAWVALRPLACIRACAEVSMVVRTLCLHAAGAPVRAVCARFFNGKGMGSSGRTAAVVAQAS